jgi:LPXTG-motif cell wall-anchored protein
MPGSMLFGIGTLPSSGDVFSNGLTSAQQQWVQNALTAWVSAVGNTWCGSGGAGAGLCPDISGNLVWPTALPVVTQAFQAWFNNSGTQQGGQITSNGTFDATTLAALMGLAASASWGAGVGSCPGSCGLSPSNPSNAPATTSSNTIYYVLGGAAVLALGGAAIYVARKRKRRAA